MKSEKRVVGETRRVEKPLVFPLVAEEEGACVFEEAGDAPVSLRRKAQFFINHQLYARAMAILKLLRIWVREMFRYSCLWLAWRWRRECWNKQRIDCRIWKWIQSIDNKSLLCWSELERHRWG